MPNTSTDLGLPAPRSDQPIRTEPGLPLPLGVYPRDGGTNFSLFSRHATCIWLELYESPDDQAPTHRFELSAEWNQTGDIWHIWLDSVEAGRLYGYRAEGPYDPQRGHRFNPHKLLVDPYATAITHLDNWDFRRAHGFDSDSSLRDLSYSESNNADAAPKCVVTSRRTGWERTRHRPRPWSETVIYELHVRGFTNHPSAEVEHPGTYRGLIEKIPYLKDLGVTTVELMPVQEFNEHELARVNPHTGEPLRNYWGYNPAAFMAPNGFYAAEGCCGEQVQEFKDMVKAFHEADIEVILDVVFNHTAEGSELGPTISWRGLGNSIYYLLAEDPRFYRDYTGTGNTLKAQHPIVREMILDALRHWVVEMHVDGFRFDLASVLGRDEDGSLHADPPLLERIAEDPVLRNVKMIAEAWDAAGAYQVGTFHARRWSEWNGRFRDDVRKFWRGDADMLADFASRLAGSSDLYEGSGKGPECSINYVTSHDGFTLNDLVSYEHKHNEPNGEFNRDGTDANYSANYGVEGTTEDPEIEAVRRRQVKNFLLTLFVSRGVPMLLGGDEFRRTQDGNNNAYCQDNETGWWLWDRLEAYDDIHRFTRELIAFRKDHPVLHRMEFYDDEIQWMGPEGNAPCWDDSEARQLACRVREEDDTALLLLFNAGTDTVDFALSPAPDGHTWHLKADTSRAAPDDFCSAGTEQPIDSLDFSTAPRSSAILVSRPTGG